MWTLMTQPGLATAVVDFTHDLSLLTIRLLGLVGLSAGMILFAAIRHSLSQQIELGAKTAPVAADD